MKTEIKNDEVAELRQLVEKLQEENNSLAMQLGHAFEELTLIQELAAHLAISEADSEAPASSRLVGARFAELLTQTLDTLEGESLCLLTATHDVVWTVGEQRPDGDWRRLSESLAMRLSAGPVVWNQPWGDTVQHAVLAQLSNGGKCYGWLVACNRIGALAQDGFTSFEASFLTKVASMLAVHLHNTKLLHDSQALFGDMVRALVSAVDARDPYTCGHSERVALFARKLASAAGLPPAECRRIYFCGLLHDIGKLAVPDAILRKKDRLSDEERRIMANHPENGRKILANVDALTSMLDGVLHHHECMDGSGYPMQLRGESIPTDARLLAICDAYDAMTSDRPYRDGMAPERAAEILREGAGTQWDAALVDTFLANLEAMMEIAREHAAASRKTPCQPRS